MMTHSGKVHLRDPTWVIPFDATDDQTMEVLRKVHFLLENRLIPVAPALTGRSAVAPPAHTLRDGGGRPENFDTSRQSSDDSCQTRHSG